jgi:hypothetical protein
MDEITIPYHLAIPTIICVVGLGVLLFYRKKLFPKNKVFWGSITVFLVLYLLIVAGATYDDIYYQWDLNRYDLNKDGIFSGQEITQEQKNAMERLTNDVGRNFSFITGFIFTLIISSMVYVVGLLFSKFSK